ncbi:hypothetical protein VY88_06635 [Azospirillum thiophilum]|uniref:Lipoprotein n=1 Tax=Azospirillum thiophilum TaxID=528244 RepID=A0AAC8VWN5_9PROT|nr:hypothetical protein [Azospirillum thiophilum]ALG70551.1 hypothetical protein AL072_06075 [Azospirillum thiophilum]KJR65778.1 hypothetical protein VY88_06635 [Azospirillum thiophilum]
MLSRRLLLAAGTATLLLAACQSTPPRPAPRPIDFSNFGPIVLNAGIVDVVDSYRPMGAKHVEGRSPVPPAEAVRRWAAERLQAAGGPGRVRVTIRDAGIVEVPLPTKKGISGYFTNDQAQRYDGRIEVEVAGEVPDTGSGGFRGVTRSTVTQSTTVAENISLADREATFLDLTRRMMDDLNARLDAGIRKDLAPMVRR